METNDSGKGFSAFTVVRALGRRKLFLLVPVVLVTAAASIYSLRLPELFRARALIAAVTPSPGDYPYGRSGAVTTANIQDQLRTIAGNAV